jgi:hypothetical protein
VDGNCSDRMYHSDRNAGTQQRHTLQLSLLGRLQRVYPTASNIRRLAASGKIFFAFFTPCLSLYSLTFHLALWKKHIVLVVALETWIRFCTPFFLWPRNLAIADSVHTHTHDPILQVRWGPTITNLHRKT